MPATRPPGGLRQFIDTAGWQATSSPEYDLLPHEYTVRGRACAGKPPVPTDWFDWVRNLIRTEGYKQPYTNPNTGTTYTYKYLDYDGYKYWCFQFVINREPLTDPSAG